MVANFQLFSSLRYDAALLQVADSPLNDSGWNRVNKSPFYMLDFHRDRMLRAATHWGWDAAVEALSGDAGLQRLEEALAGAIGEKQSAPLRVRVVISEQGAIEIVTGKVLETTLSNLYPAKLPVPGEAPTGPSEPNSRQTTTPSKVPTYEVVVDESGTARSEYTHFKTTKRAMYDVARQRARISPTDAKEVLIVYDVDGHVMEGSTTTPYFWRGGRWVTPAVSSQYSLDSGSGGQDGTTRRWILEKGLAFEDVILASSLVDGEECWLSNGVRGFMFGRIKLHHDT
ncbi:putative 4-amino-4-deoxychorismate protein [Lasiosphaeria miniovina]|uniref:4-amino-4-deoxychorismate protein n=1 Tax=Lasiosphaeria miniovina TaxID=1954250 RepID=A0AA40B3M4_9PEZI|nr:putative 4-amino-4-deoxychorismate protein [Lasiosphaeria miniovina]KAK0727075.1 putative 4-amino-4-deoxychorismate protein [Lasiosphaeria miniovina]